MANNFLPQNNPINHHADPDLDQQIDRALESYLPQPRAGLQQRILARTESVTPRPRWFQLRFAFLGATVLAACALLAIFLALPGRVTAPHGTNTVASNAHKPAPHKTASTHLATLTPKPALKHTPPHGLHRTRHIPHQTNLPRLAVFPAPAPPTPQEQELAELAARYPKLLKEATRPMPQPKPQPISIQPLQIKPIEIEPLTAARINHQISPISHHSENAQ